MAAQLQIYGMGLSTCTQRAVQSAIENNADFKINHVDLFKGEHKQPAHLARQPFGVIPALEDGKVTLYESRAIARYIDATRGGKLTPAEPQARALMEQWLSLEQGTYTPEISGIVAQRVFAPMSGGKPDEAKVAEHAAKLPAALDILDKHLSTNKWLAGEQFSLAEVAFAPYLNYFQKTPEWSLISSRKNIDAWFKRVLERPSWVKTQSYNELNKKQ